MQHDTHGIIHECFRKCSNEAVSIFKGILVIRGNHVHLQYNESKVTDLFAEFGSCETFSVGVRPLKLWLIVVVEVFR